MLNYGQLFGNVFERRESKCCAVLMKHCRKGKSEQVITLQMAQQLKTKNINVLPRQLCCRQCKAKLRSVTDTSNELTECQTPRKKLQSISISPVSLHGFMGVILQRHKTLKSDIAEA